MAEKLNKDQIVEAISNLTVIELADLVKSVEEKFGVKAMPAMGMAMAAAPAAGGAATAVEEQTEFTVVLKGCPDSTRKISVIKVVREITGLGLAESKALVEGAPKNVKENVDKKTSEELKKKLEDAGAQVELK
ncbi:MAG: 50S ribosomal protein L7/L12 [Elusimicrobia bacterium CG08_land_8_20_14_0_20_51_18]|nr:MAG: 50S ribosomal protein L7/L12 [Elusimicrobia bacterium CG08_land_8_20_14_0_20_51_18]